MKNLKWLLNILSILIFLTGVTALTYAPFRRDLTDFFKFERRTVLATAETSPTSDTKFKIIKLKNNTGVILEIYDANDASMPLLDSLFLGQGSDTFFTYNGRTSNLFIDNPDTQGSIRILIPSLDQDMVAHLNSIQFDLSSKKLYLENQ